MAHAVLRGEESLCVLDAHGQHLADAPALEQNAQGLGIEAPAAADIAQHLYIGEKIHLDALHALALAGFAAAAGGVEGEAAGGEAADARLCGLGEQAPDGIPKADIGGRAGPRRLADGRLVHLEYAADGLEAGNRRAAFRVEIDRAAL